MKIEKSTVIVALLIMTLVVVLFQNRSLSRKLAFLEYRVDDAVYAAEEAREFAEEARDYAEQASRNAFGNSCYECPESLRYR